MLSYIVTKFSDNWIKAYQSRKCFMVNYWQLLGHKSAPAEAIGLFFFKFCWDITQMNTVTKLKEDQRKHTGLFEKQK